MTDQVSIALGKEEALVLFDLLARWIEDEKGNNLKSQIRDDAELWALNGVYSSLERVLSEPFGENYLAVLKEARKTLKNARGGNWPFLP